MSASKICIIGLGYIGLPTAAMFATHGHKIVGVDINGGVVDALNQGKITITEPYLDIMVQAAVTSGNLVGKVTPESADVFIIAVPTPITEDKKADMSYVIAATEAIVPYLKKDNIVILESTSPVGTVKDIICPILEKTGLVLGEELFVAHSPERVLPGRILIELVDNNRIVGGINEKSAQLVKELYKTFVRGKIFTTDATTAEMCKLMENTYRDVNIALANELAIISEKLGINAWKVIELCNKHPRVNIHQPGPGVGGHCLAVDPWFIVEKFPETASLIEKSRKINDNMPEHVLGRIGEILGDVSGKKVITILGVTYKPDIDDIRESPIEHLVGLLEADGNYEIRIVDPFVHNHKYIKKDLINACEGSDLVLLAVNHKDFGNIQFNKVSKVMRTKNILDTRNFFDKKVILESGFRYFLLGSN
ncbi:MAG: nucleotide sugar dehydrogenase [Clostridiaceae bacterium]|nr:nucleotide sugar dehydrogenase [Clostridiaceae bacterium]